MWFEHSKDMCEKRSCGQVILWFDRSKDMWEERSCGKVILWFDHSKDMQEERSLDRYYCGLTTAKICMGGEVMWTGNIVV